MTKEEMRAHLRAERLASTQRLMSLKAQQREIAADIEKLEERLRDIDHAEGYLG